MIVHKATNYPYLYTGVSSGIITHCSTTSSPPIVTSKIIYTGPTPEGIVIDWGILCLLPCQYCPPIPHLVMDMNTLTGILSRITAFVFPPPVPPARAGELLLTLLRHYPIIASLCSQLHAYELANFVLSSRKLHDTVKGTLGQGSIYVKTARWTCGGSGVEKFSCSRCKRTCCRVCKFRSHPYSEGKRQIVRLIRKQDCRYLKIVGLLHECHSACLHCRLLKLRDGIGQWLCANCKDYEVMKGTTLIKKPMHLTMEPQ